MRLQGRRILITGAGSGIGRTIAEMFCAQGASLGLLDIQAAAVAEACGSLDRCVGAACDVSDGRQVASAVAEVTASLGGLDGVVNVAGIDLIRDFASMDVEEWHRVLRVNLDGPMHVCKAALPALRGQEGATIVNIASGAGLRPVANRTAYCTSKAGLVMFTKALAMELAPHGIRVNVVCPGVIDTRMFRVSVDEAADPEAALREILGRSAMGRIGTAEDVANAALYLSCGESRYTTGSALAVDGGRVFH